MLENIEDEVTMVLLIACFENELRKYEVWNKFLRISSLRK